MKALPIALDRLAYLLAKIGLRAAGAMSRHTLEKTGTVLGRLIYRLDGRHREIVRRNLAASFPEWSGQQHEEMIRRVFANLGKTVLEIGWSAGRRPQRLKEHVQIIGLHHLKQAHRLGRGVLVLTAHLGNWELAPIAYHMTGLPGSVVYRPFDAPFLERLFGEIRSRFNTELIANNRAMRPILKSLRRGRMVGLLMDQNVDWYEGVFVDFFGHRACTSKGMALLAIKSGAPVVPGFVVRRRRCFQVRFEQALTLIRTGDRTKDIEANTLAYNQVLEAAIRRDPDQWFWVHQRWKTRPSQPWPRGQEVC